MHWYYVLVLRWWGHVNTSIMAGLWVKRKLFQIVNFLFYDFCKTPGMVSKEWFCQSMGWTAQNWSVQEKYVSSNSLKKCCSYWMWKMQSSTWTSLFWAFSLSSSDWPPTLSFVTKSRQSDSLKKKIDFLILFTTSQARSVVFNFFIALFAKVLRGQNTYRAVLNHAIVWYLPVLPHNPTLNPQKQLGGSVTRSLICIPK